MVNLKTSDTERIARLLPAFTQLCLVSSAAVSIFGYPLLFGMPAFGAFVTACALTFIVHRALDLTLESMILDKSANYILYFAAITYSISLGFFYLLSFISGASNMVVQPLLLFALVLSTSTVNLVFKFCPLLYQAVFGAGFLAVSCLVCSFFWLSGTNDIEAVSVASNLAGATLGLAVFFWAAPGEFQRLDSHMLRTLLPLKPKVIDALYRIGFASFSLLMGYGAVFLTSDKLNNIDAGLLRLFVSVALIGAWTAPISPKLYYALTRGVDTPDLLFIRLSPFLRPMYAALFCWAIFIVLIFVVGLPKGYSDIALAVAAYPTVVLSSIMDKVLLNSKGMRVSSLFVSMATFATIAALLATGNVQNITATVLCALMLYPFVIALLLLRPFLPLATLTLFLGGLAVISLAFNAAWAGLLLVCALVLPITHRGLRGKIIS